MQVAVIQDLTCFKECVLHS